MWKRSKASLSRFNILIALGIDPEPVGQVHGSDSRCRWAEGPQSNRAVSWEVKWLWGEDREKRGVRQRLSPVHFRCGPPPTVLTHDQHTQCSNFLERHREKEVKRGQQGPQRKCSRHPGGSEWLHPLQSLQCDAGTWSSSASGPDRGYWVGCIQDIPVLCWTEGSRVCFWKEWVNLTAYAMQVSLTTCLLLVSLFRQSYNVKGTWLRPAG